MAQLTPMMQQYVETKKQYSDCILFYRLGDFYEMFFEDAVTASKELEITLTGKSCGLEERAPMCGIPYHAVDGYLNKLVARGYKVAICEQLEDPKTTKGIVKRDVIRIVTPGTNLSTQMLEDGKNNYLLAVFCDKKGYGISCVDVTTGDYSVTEVDTAKKVLDEINKFAPSEIICNEAFFESQIDLEDLKNRLGIAISDLDSWYFDRDLCERSLKEHFQVKALEGLGLKDYSLGIIAAGAIMQYLTETQKISLAHITSIVPYITNHFMLLDSATRRNLELVETLREKQKRGSLLWVLDKTKTAMGARLLRTYVEQPLIEKEAINRRLDAIEELNENAITREELREYLNPIYDLERLIGKVAYKNANPRDLISLRASLEMLPPIKMLLGDMQTEDLKQIYESMDTLEELCQLIQDSIEEEPPITVKEGGIIRDGFHKEIDTLRKAKTEGKSWLAEMEIKEREKTGIKNLKIKFNKVFGYYLEVTNSYKELVPKDWTRKQTLANAERYTTSELKELEDTILGAEDKLFALEYEIFTQIREEIASNIKRIQKTAKAIAKIDAFTSLALVSERNNYVRPTINENGTIHIKEGRHPVVEQVISNDAFVTNDTLLDNENNRISIITGPNMAGKSTYMRQTALIVLMAQIGCFVPAKAADVGVVDRIFTRVGASDDLASGQSTFMVEMTEVANILRNATKNSLLILDEIGRGTSTFDGLSIAWAVVEHIANPALLGAKTLFATHYHELTELEGKLDSVNNYCIAVSEQGDDIVFLRKIKKGGADKSYGIQVAKLAGVPENVLTRAKEIVEQLADNDITEKARQIDVSIETAVSMETSVPIKHNVGRKKKKVDDNQLSMFDGFAGMPSTEDILVELRDMDLNAITPMDALNKLYQIQQKVKERW